MGKINNNNNNNNTFLAFSSDSVFVKNFGTFGHFQTFFEILDLAIRIVSVSSTFGEGKLYLM
jgi:hypothetical protein